MRPRVFEPTSEEMLEMCMLSGDKMSAANLFVDQLKVKVKLEIKDNMEINILGYVCNKQEKSRYKSRSGRTKLLLSEENPGEKDI